MDDFPQIINVFRICGDRGSFIAPYAESEFWRRLRSQLRIASPTYGYAVVPICSKEELDMAQYHYGLWMQRAVKYSPQVIARVAKRFYENRRPGNSK